MKSRLGLSFFLSLSVCFYSYLATAQIQFEPHTIIGTGGGPYAIVATDVNGDGRLDLICSDLGAIPAYNGNILTILTNNGADGVDSNTALVTASGPVSVVAADINNDGWVDLMCANHNGNLMAQQTLSIFTNNGSGGFGLSSSPIVAGRPDCITAADINKDGYMDLICTFNSSLWVATNNGHGDFGSNNTLEVGDIPVWVTAADMNRDGAVDLICAGRSNNTLMVFTNYNNGDFGASVTMVVGTWPTSVVAADINGDGRQDLVCANEADNTLSVMTNNGSGGYVSASIPIVGFDPVSVVAADMDGDGKMDLVCANRGGYPNYFGTLSVLRNKGNGIFESNATYSVGIMPRMIAAADINGDGKMDLACTDYGNDRVSLLINKTDFPPSVSKPVLKIKHLDSGVLVCWPSGMAGWSLQQKPDVVTARWAPSGYSGYPLDDDGTNGSLMITPTPGETFFRLLHP